jgi:hypothetical protein
LTVKCALLAFQVTLASTEREVQAIVKLLSQAESPAVHEKKRASLETGLSYRSISNLGQKRGVNFFDSEAVSEFIRYLQDRPNTGGVQAEAAPKKVRPKDPSELPIWQPDALPHETPSYGKQYEFLEAWEDVVLIEGGKGSGKTDLLIMDCIRPEKLANPVWHGVIFRREYKRLTEVIDRAHYWLNRMPRLHAHWQGQESRFVFPSGAWLAFHNAEHLGDEEKYQGWQISDLKFDQVEEFEEAQFDYLLLQNRSGDLRLPSTCRATANPGGRGHAWVKRRFISPFEPSRTHVVTTEAEGLSYTRTYRRIHATVFDNPLLRHDQAYIATLASHRDPVMRKAMFQGDWNIVTGQFFTEFATHIHVLRPGREIPRTWPRAAGMDFGNTKVLSILAIDPEGRVYLEHEFAVEHTAARPTGYTAGEFARATAEWLIERKFGAGLLCVYDNNMTSAMGREVGTNKTPVQIVESEWRAVYGRHNLTPPTLVAVSKRATEEYRYRVACNEAVKDYLHYELDETGRMVRTPRFYVRAECVHFLDTFPDLVADPNDVADLADGQDDHSYDAFKMPFMQLFAKPKQTPRATAAEQWQAQLTEVKLVAPKTPVVNLDWRGNW